MPKHIAIHLDDGITMNFSASITNSASTLSTQYTHVSLQTATHLPGPNNRIYYCNKDAQITQEKKVIDDIYDELEDTIDSGTSIILLADLNERVNDIENTNNKFHEICLFNVLHRRLGSYNLPRTHILGSKTIDHIWTTISVYDAIDIAGFAPFPKY